MIESVDFEENTFIAKSNHPDECFDRKTSKLMLEDLFRHGPTFMKLTDVLQSKIIIDCTGNDDNFTETLAENIWTGLMCACFHGCTNIIELLLNAKANTEIKDSYGKTALKICCDYNKCDSLQTLIKFRDQLTDGAGFIDIDSVDKNGCTNLLYACDREYTNLVEILLSAQADANISDNELTTPLIICCYASGINMCEILKLLLNHRDVQGKGVDIDTVDDDGDTGLIHACMNGFIDRVEILLSNKADVDLQNNNESTALMKCCEFNQFESLKLILKHRNESIDGAGIDINATNKHRHTALMLACEYKGSGTYRNNIFANEIVDLLISLNADMKYRIDEDYDDGDDDDGDDHENITKSAFTISVDVGNCYVVEKLLTDSDNSVTPYIDINQPYDGNTPLNHACSISNVQLIEILLSHKADASINTRNNPYQSAVLICCERGYYPILELLLVKYKDNSPDLNIDDYDVDGKTGLMWICLNLKRERLDYSLDGIKLLLDANASPYASDNGDRTPLSVSTNYDKVQEMLISYANTKYVFK
jgi:ankyrin repeat protein